MPSDEYVFPELPLSGVPPGTSILVEGSYHGGTRDLAYRLLDSQANEGQVIVSTSHSPDQLYREYQALGLSFHQHKTAILDCIGGSTGEVPARRFSVSSAEDLTGITMRLAKAYQDLASESIRRVRMGVVSVSALLTIGDVRNVFRFVSTLTGRISNVGGLGMFVVDPAVHDARTVETLGQFVHGRVQIRDDEGTRQLRSVGIAGQSREWRA